MRLTRRDRLILFAPAAVLLAGWLILPAVLGLLASFTDYSPFRQASTSPASTTTPRYLGIRSSRRRFATLRSSPWLPCPSSSALVSGWPTSCAVPSGDVVSGRCCF